ncbi:DUF305 domain-containing protein [Rhizobium sp. RAF36]|uniref:DUF305 domain-containing protein n=1 Tax=Rhizobium sp. RAF36 TaxID=3233055 RepID=UPI003F9A9233
MTRDRKRRVAFVMLAGLAFCGGIAVASSASAPKLARGATEEAEYLAENDAAMTTMMQGVAAQPTGDIDRDFVVMMVPHHQGAIDMAVSYLKFGRNEQLRRIAQEIIVDQQQEIIAMKMAVGEPMPQQSAAPTQSYSEPSSAPAMQRMDPNMKM